MRDALHCLSPITIPGRVPCQGGVQLLDYCFSRSSDGAPTSVSVSIPWGIEPNGSRL